MRPHFWPVFCMQERTRYATVVLPFVPVTARLVSFDAGFPKLVCASMAAAFAGSSTGTNSHLSLGATVSRRQTMYSAPFEIACAMKSAPSHTVPLTATKISPGLTRRESTRIEGALFEETSFISSSRFIILYHKGFTRILADVREIAMKIRSIMFIIG